MLYKILYELRGNVADLRRDMTSLRKQLDDARDISQATANLYGSALSPISADKLPSVTTGSSIDVQPKSEEADAEEIAAEPESLNLDNLGRQMVEKALERNAGNRKKAAQELGISDRTLYRRIKKYGLDNNDSSEKTK